MGTNNNRLQSFKNYKFMIQMYQFVRIKNFNELFLTKSKNIKQLATITLQGVSNSCHAFSLEKSDKIRNEV